MYCPVCLCTVRAGGERVAPAHLLAAVATAIFSPTGARDTFLPWGSVCARCAVGARFRRTCACGMRVVHGMRVVRVGPTGQRSAENVCIDCHTRALLDESADEASGGDTRSATTEVASPTPASPSPTALPDETHINWVRVGAALDRIARDQQQNEDEIDSFIAERRVSRRVGTQRRALRRGARRILSSTPPGSPRRTRRGGPRAIRT